MVLTRKDVIMGKVEREDMAEVLKVKFVMNNGRKGDLVLIYVPPKTNAWGREEYENMVKDTYNCLRNMIGNSDGRFQLQRSLLERMVYWRRKSWGDLLLNLLMNNMMIQWIKENTRFRGNEEPSRLTGSN